jgi:hypothetical protein
LPSDRPVVLFLSHVLNGAILAECRRLEEQLAGRCLVRFAWDDTDGEFDAAALEPVPTAPWRFTHAEIFEQGYPRKGATRRFHPGNADLVLLRYFHEHPDAPFYWLIEHDVRFSGSWSDLFDAVSQNDADLVGTTLWRRHALPDWRFWYTVGAPHGEAVPPARMIRGFFPIVRLSRRAVAALDAAYRRGWMGHCEATIPTILNEQGMRLLDLGGDGEFVPDGWTNRFYTNTPTDRLLSPGTFVFRPRRAAPGTQPGMLWHPIKGAGDRTWVFRPWRDWLDRLRARREQWRYHRASAAHASAAAPAPPAIRTE